MVGKVLPQSVEQNVLVTSKKRVQLTMEGGIGFKKESESTEEKVKGD